MRSRKIAALLSAALLLGTVAVIPVSAADDASKAIALTDGGYEMTTEPTEPYNLTGEGAYKPVSTFTDNTLTMTQSTQFNDSNDGKKDIIDTYAFDVGPVAQGETYVISYDYSVYSSAETENGFYINYAEEQADNVHKADSKIGARTYDGALFNGQKGKTSNIWIANASTPVTGTQQFKITINGDNNYLGICFYLRFKNNSTYEVKISNFSIKPLVATVNSKKKTTYYSDLKTALEAVGSTTNLSAAPGGTLTINKNTLCMLDSRLFLKDATIETANNINATIQWASDAAWNKNSILTSGNVAINGDITIKRQDTKSINSPTISVQNGKLTLDGGVKITGNQWAVGNCNSDKAKHTPNQCGAVEVKGATLELKNVTFYDNVIDVYTRQASSIINTTNYSGSKIKLNPTAVNFDAVNDYYYLDNEKIGQGTNADSFDLYDNEGKPINNYYLSLVTEEQMKYLVTKKTAENTYFEFDFSPQKDVELNKAELEVKQRKFDFNNIKMADFKRKATASLASPINITKGSPVVFYVSVNNMPVNVTIDSITLN